MSDQAKDDPQTIEEGKLDPSIKLCPKCGGVMFACRINGFGAALSVEPMDKRLLEDRNSAVRGIGCGVCGYLELFARFPAALRPKSSR